MVMSQLVFISNKEITEALMSGQELLQRSEKPVRSSFSLPCLGEKSLLKPAARWYCSGPCKQPGNKSGACPLGHFLLNLQEAVFGTYVPSQPAFYWHLLRPMPLVDNTLSLRVGCVLWELQK